jgi:hypothetical protein
MLIGLVALALLAPIASASESEEIRFGGGRVGFIADGDKLAAEDLRADGYRVRAYLQWRYKGRKYVARVTDGSRFGDRQRSLKIREGTRVKLIGCYVRGNVRVKCSRPQHGEA